MRLFPSEYIRAVLLGGGLLLAGTSAYGAGLAPEVKVERLDGTAFFLDSLKGKVVVLDFWAPWCVPCRKSFPFLDGLQQRYGAGGLVVLGLTLERKTDSIQDFLADFPVSFQVVRDTSAKSGSDFGVVAMPTTFLLDREGRIAARFEGGDPSTHEKIEAAAKRLLAGEGLPAGTDVRVSASLEATGAVKAWQRGFLADPIMNLDGDMLTRVLREHVHASKEGAAGDGGAAGGGCGCN
jgi:thiol-disulfide isomerase/thioredoxin